MFFQAEHTAPIGVSDVLLGLLIIIIIVIMSSSTKTQQLKEGQLHYKYYTWNVYFKLFFALAYGAVYVFYYQGGDTMAYWKGAEKLNNLMWASPGDYWTELITTSSEENVILRFNSETGYPPIWIYSDPKSFFVSKVISVVMIFCGQSYVALTLIFGYISAMASWKVFEIVRFYKITSDWLASVSILFIPSVAFWCAGVSKDTVVFVAVLYLLYHFFGIANQTAKRNTYSLLLICIYGFTLYTTRTFMLFTVIAPMGLVMMTRITKRYKDSAVLASALRIIVISLGLFAFLFFLQSQGDKFAETANDYLTEAQVRQSDFATNDSYGDKRYDLGITDYSPVGMLRVAPLAIFTAIYRPGLWEARSPLLLVSGLETALFMWLTVLFIFKGKLMPKINFIRYNEFLVFAFLFSIILAYFAGFTSGLFGVLVRFKAPLLPFLLIVFTTNPKAAALNEQNEEKLTEIQTG